jgi:hypothetical protein
VLTSLILSLRHIIIELKIKINADFIHNCVRNILKDKNGTFSAWRRKKLSSAAIEQLSEIGNNTLDNYWIRFPDFGAKCFRYIVEKNYSYL